MSQSGFLIDDIFIFEMNKVKKELQPYQPEYENVPTCEYFVVSQFW